MDLFLRRKNFSKSGFTLIETLVAIGVITVGLVSALTLINTSLFYVFNISDRLIAANLAAEGIELVRNIRDGNWLQGTQWDSGLNDGDYQLGYRSDRLRPFGLRGDSLLIDSDGFYNYISGGITPYKRKISIMNLSGYEIRVISLVTWERKGISYTSSAEDHLFDWK